MAGNCFHNLGKVILNRNLVVFSSELNLIFKLLLSFIFLHRFLLRLFLSFFKVNALECARVGDCSG